MLEPSKELSLQSKYTKPLMLPVTSLQCQPSTLALNLCYLTLKDKP